jgi:hypothetical protein
LPLCRAGFDALQYPPHSGLTHCNNPVLSLLCSSHYLGFRWEIVRVKSCWCLGHPPLPSEPSDLHQPTKELSPPCCYYFRLFQWEQWSETTTNSKETCKNNPANAARDHSGPICQLLTSDKRWRLKIIEAETPKPVQPGQTGCKCQHQQYGWFWSGRYSCWCNGWQHQKTGCMGHGLWQCKFH